MLRTRPTSTLISTTLTLKTFSTSLQLLHPLIPTSTTSNPTPKAPPPPLENSTKPFSSSVPYYASHLIIHSPTPSSNWPSHFPASSLPATLYKRAKRWRGLVSMSSDPDATIHQSLPSKYLRNKVAPDVHVGLSDTSLDATLYRPGELPLPTLPISFGKYFPEYLGDLTAGRSPAAGAEKETHIYVCTHMARDCRCGEIGGAVFRELKEEVRRMGDRGRGVKVREISHVGGHVWAANVLIYPKGDWYGRITPSDIPHLLSIALSPSRSIWPSKWRGRLGLSPSEQVELMEKELHIEHSPDPDSPARESVGKEKEKEKVKLSFMMADGSLRTLEADEGETLMNIGKRAGFGSIEGACGGKLECATCHIYIPSSLSPSTTTIPPPPLPPMSEEEEDMLAYAIAPHEGSSRLGCQIRATKELGEWCRAGGRIGIPKY